MRAVVRSAEPDRGVRTTNEHRVSSLAQLAPGPADLTPDATGCALDRQTVLTAATPAHELIERLKQ